MTTSTTTIELNDGTTVYIEAEEIEGGLERAGGEETPATLEQALDRIRPIANAVIAKIRAIDVTPDELEVKFGVKLSVGANVVISKTAAEANFEFKLVWKRASVDGSAKGGSAAAVK